MLRRLHLHHIPCILVFIVTGLPTTKAFLAAKPLLQGGNKPAFVSSFLIQSLKNAASPATKKAASTTPVHASNRKENYSSKAALTTAKEVSERHGEDTSSFIRFSHCFQRHVVHHRTNKDTHDTEILESFSFLDDALEAYPHATVETLSSPMTVQVLGYVSSVTPWSLYRNTMQEDTLQESNHTSNTTMIGTTSNTTWSHAYEALWELSTLLSSNEPPPSSQNDAMNAFQKESHTDSLRNDHDEKSNNSVQLQLQLQQTSQQLANWIGMHRFQHHNATSIRNNYYKLMSLLSHQDNNQNGNTKNSTSLRFAPLGAHGVIRNFPQLCLYDVKEVQERIEFLVRPLPPSSSLISTHGKTVRQSKNGGAPEKKGKNGKGSVKGGSGARRAPMQIDGADWPKRFQQGYGAGLSIKQATQAIQTIPELLAMQLEDARKPSMAYFYQRLGVSFQDVQTLRDHFDKVESSTEDNNANAKATASANAKTIANKDTSLALSLAGCDASDACSLAYLHAKLRVSYKSLECLVEALPTLTYCDLEVNWDVEGPHVRKVLKPEVLCYWRRRLQIRPCEVHGMIRTHSRLSTYDLESKIKPTMDAIQSALGLSCVELRTVLLRMPSLIGMGTKEGKEEKDEKEEKYGKDQEGSLPSSTPASFFSSQSGLGQRLHFFLEQVGMSQEDLRKAVLKQPSLLHYSVQDSLLPKLEFLTKDLCIPPSAIPRLIRTAPSIMGSSLEENLRPKALFLSKACELSLDEVGIVLSTSPPVMTLSLERKLRPTLSFLTSALGIVNERELGYIVLTAPRVVLHSVDTSLRPKLDLLRKAVERERQMKMRMPISKTHSDPSSYEAAASFVKRNPPLLVSSMGVLRNRVEKELGKESSCSLVDALRPSTRGRKRQFRSTVELDDHRNESVNDTKNTVRRRSRAVVELSSDLEGEKITQVKVLNMYPSVKVASERTGISTSLLYAACRRGLTAKGRFFAYAMESVAKDNVQKGDEQNIRSYQHDEIGIVRQNRGREREFEHKREEVASANKRMAQPGQFLKRNPSRGGNGFEAERVTLKNSEVGTGIQEQASKEQAQLECPPDSFELSILVSGRMFPADNIRLVRGTRKAGGLAIFAPNIGSLRSLVESSFGMVVPEVNQNKGEAIGTNFERGRICVGFPFLRPSRKRCELYACHAALKLCLQLFRRGQGDALRTQIGGSNMNSLTSDKVHVSICTDSTYAWKLLKNVQLLSKLGEMRTMDEFLLSSDFNNNKSGVPPHLANPDLLYPLCQTYGRLTKGGVCDGASYEGFFFADGCRKDVVVEFRLVGDCGLRFTQPCSTEQWSSLADSATFAAKWMYHGAQAT